MHYTAMLFILHLHFSIFIRSKDIEEIQIINCFQKQSFCKWEMEFEEHF